MAGPFCIGIHRRHISRLAQSGTAVRRHRLLPFDMNVECERCLDRRSRMTGRPRAVMPIRDTFPGERQEMANRGVRRGLLTRPIDLREAVLMQPIACGA